MKTNRPHLLNPHAFAACAASIRTWLIALGAWLLDLVGEDSPIGRDVKLALRAELRQAARLARNLVFIHAAPRFDWSRKGGARRRHPVFAPEGFRRIAPRDSGRRRITKALVRGLHRGSIQDRAARVRDLLDNMEKYIARLVRRVNNGLAGARLAPTAPSAIQFFTTAEPSRAAAPDSS